MESGARTFGPAHTDPLVAAASTAATLDDLAAVLRDLRRRHARSRRDSNLTYRELAARTGWSQTAIAEYFTARTLAPTDRFDALLEVLGASPAERGALATARDRIEEADRRAKGRRGSHRRPHDGTPPPARAAQQLPAAPRTFTGRLRELTALDAALDDRTRDDGTPVVCAIGGMGGIGKTWLAVHWAHRRLDRFPDGQLYVNLRGFEPADQPMGTATAIRGFLEALGVPPAAVPAAHEAAAGLYRGLVAGRRMLILLDNARDTAQVTALLPADASCTVLITSRHQLTGLIATHGARSVVLDVLPDADARRLLARHLGRARLDAEREATAALLAGCAGLPLALGIVAARAAVQPHLALAALADELGKGAQRLDGLDAGEPQVDLRAVLSWSSRALPAAAAAAFALLGVAPGPDLALSAAANLLGLPPAKARVVLRTLEHASLVQRHAPERYRMHDLVRLYAAEQADDQRPAAEVQSSLRSLVDFYAHTAFIGAQLLAQRPVSGPLLTDSGAGSATHPLPDWAAALAWFDAEHSNLLAAQHLARRHGWDPQVYRLAWALDPYHRRRGHLTDQVGAWQLAVTSARNLAGEGVRIQAHQMLGDAYAQLGHTTEALRSLHKALILAEQTGDVLGQGHIQHSLGGTWERRDDLHRALRHAVRALRIFESLGDDYQHARALNAVGWLQCRLGQFSQARVNCEAALVLLRRQPLNNQQLGEADTLDSLGLIAQNLREYERALDYYGQALDTCRVQGHSHLEADVLRHIAETQFARRRFDPAREAWQRARDLYAAQHRLANAAHVGQQLDRVRPDGRARVSTEADPTDGERHP